MSEIEIIKPVVQIGNARFDVLMKEGFYSVAGSDMPRFHCHPDYEVHCIEKGTFTYQLESGAYRVSAPAILLFPPLVYHGFREMSDGAEKCCFEFELLANGEGGDFREYAALLSGLSGVKNVRCAFPPLSPFKNSEKNPEDFFEITSTVGAILIALFRSLRQESDPVLLKTEKKNKNRPEQTLLITNVVKYIEQHFGENITLFDAARNAHLSERQLERILKEYMHEGFLSLLNRYRIRMCVVKMMDGESDLSSLSEWCGFQNYATFWKHFTKYNGMSPRAFVKNLQTRRD